MVAELEGVSNLKSVLNQMVAEPIILVFGDDFLAWPMLINLGQNEKL